MASGNRIPIPWHHRWRRFRYGPLPAVAFCACIAAVLWLWARQAQLAAAVGELEVVRLDVVALTDGQIAAPPGDYWELFDMAEAGQILARLDARPIEAELDVVRADLAQINSELEAAAQQVKFDHANLTLEQQREAMRLAWENERQRLDVLDRRALIQADQVELKRLDAQYEFLKASSGGGMVTGQTLTEAKLLRDAVESRIQANTAALREAERQMAAGAKRLAGHALVDLGEVEQLLAPHQAAIAAQEARVRQLELQVEYLELPSPITGMIAAIHRWPGQNVRAGDPIMTIAATGGRYIVSYLRQDQRFRPQPGMMVEIRPRLAGARRLQAKVERVGSQFELIPERQRTDARLMEWGLPVRISIPPEANIRPGELVDVYYRPYLAQADPG